MHDREEARTDVYSDHTFIAGSASSRQILSAEDAEGPFFGAGEGGKPTWGASVNFIFKDPAELNEVFSVPPVPLWQDKFSLACWTLSCAVPRKCFAAKAQTLK